LLRQARWALRGIRELGDRYFLAGGLFGPHGRTDHYGKPEREE